MKMHPVQRFLESYGIRTFPYTVRFTGIQCLGAYCTLRGLLQAVATASTIFPDKNDFSLFINDIGGATTNTGRLFYWSNIRFDKSENISKDIISD